MLRRWPIAYRIVGGCESPGRYGSALTAERSHFFYQWLLGFRTAGHEWIKWMCRKVRTWAHISWQSCHVEQWIYHVCFLLLKNVLGSPTIIYGSKRSDWYRYPSLLLPSKSKFSVSIVIFLQMVVCQTITLTKSQSQLQMDVSIVPVLHRERLATQPN